MNNSLMLPVDFSLELRGHVGREQEVTCWLLYEMYETGFVLSLQLSALLFCLQLANTQGKYDMLAPAQRAQNLPSQSCPHPRNQNLTMEETAVQVVTR